MDMTLASLQAFQRDFDAGHEGRSPFLEDPTDDKVPNLEHLIVCLAGELGEFANIVKKVRRGDFEYEHVSTDLTNELADVLAYMLKTANLMQIDLAQAYMRKMNENKIKFQSYES